MAGFETNVDQKNLKERMIPASSSISVEERYWNDQELFLLSAFKTLSNYFLSTHFVVHSHDIPNRKCKVLYLYGCEIF